ncbi:PH domain-containing protein [Hazenella sp. IB182357]|uniref:PH domain-containing protein n=1 Tax=Polycladospora coralii TaxID=2771432 RepID=A0A926NBE1_9BACL|nr:PH domain-containing protein [Polycladospora coralii]MBD1373791.1 PH domain-containing protein [Polycladospora coralii]MBS7531557.1 PH domain-containing protein [Polycladospora coralii]
MFGKVASDMMGLSDVGTIIAPQDYDKVDADDYVMHEDQEKIYFVIKSKSDEYCFTNKAFIHLDGQSAVSKKRLLKRYDYYLHPISFVTIETAGTVDLDVEIKFKLGENLYSIDVKKSQLEQLKDLYKSLLKISETMADNAMALEYAKQSLQIASSTLGRVNNQQDTPLTASFNEINQHAFTWLYQNTQKYRMKDFGYIFEQYINN